MLLAIVSCTQCLTFATQTVHPDVAKMAAAMAAQPPPSRNPAPASNPYVLDPKDHPQLVRAPIPEQIGRGGMVLGPRDANGGYMVISPVNVIFLFTLVSLCI